MSNQKNLKDKLINQDNLISASNIIIQCSLVMLPALIGIPEMSPYISIMGTEFAQRIIKLNNEFLNEIDRSQINKKDCNSPEFMKLVKKAVKYTCNDMNDEKIRYYVKILKDSLISTEEGRKYNYDYMDILGKISIQELYILKEFYLQQKDISLPIKEQIEERNGLREEYVLEPSKLEKYGIKEEEIPFSCKRLESTGLISEITGTFINYTGGSYYITPNLKDLMKKLDIEDINKKITNKSINGKN